MKKWVLLFAACLCFSAVASAQAVKITRNWSLHRVLVPTLSRAWR